MIHPALFYEQGRDKTIICGLCAHICHLAPAQKGRCGVRQNDNGVLRTLVYGHTLTTSADPIEKKPLYHLLPGSLAFSIATIGCNFTWQFCQNWRISQASHHGDNPNAIGCDILPAEVVSAAQQAGCASIAYTYTEPTIYYEYARDCAYAARDAGLKNIFVTNGYMMPAVVKDAAYFLDAANVDLKSFSEHFYQKICGASLQPVLTTIKAMREQGIWVEVTTLLIPGWNDSVDELTKIAHFLVSVDPNIPWHISRYHPQYLFDKAPVTPLQQLELARDIGFDAGLRYIYLGNVAHGGDTVCPICKKMLVKREGDAPALWGMSGASCAHCAEKIPGIW